ncbi:MAG: hypothetical protein R3C11_05555 [Planctomycetaceae bacterium]
MLVQFITGSIYAALYPLVQLRLGDNAYKQILIAAHDNSTQEHRFYLDPNLMKEFVSPPDQKRDVLTYSLTLNDQSLSVSQ